MPIDLPSALLGACTTYAIHLLITRHRVSPTVPKNVASNKTATRTTRSSIYSPPKWASCLQPPTSRLNLGHLPTPIHRWHINTPPSTRPIHFFIKRDDYSGSEMSGNKVRKLEFLLAKAVEEKCDSVITVGGIQSNHCRATAAAAARVGLKAHLILRTNPNTLTNQDPGWCGNLLVSRLVGATLHLVTNDEYATHPQGGWGLVQDVQKTLESSGNKPFAFPSGGSCSLGVWGYLEAVEEIKQYLAQSNLDVVDSTTTRSSTCTTANRFDRIYFACGSGGTAAGLALGMYLSGMSVAGGGSTELVAVGVDDTPALFYDKIDKLISPLSKKDSTMLQGKTSRDLLRIVDGVGLGYAQSTTQELQDIYNISKQSGVVLDPVYSGKAALSMLLDLQETASAATTATEPLRVLFIHTGGLLGFYDKIKQLEQVVALEMIQ